MQEHIALQAIYDFVLPDFVLPDFVLPDFVLLQSLIVHIPMQVQSLIVHIPMQVQSLPPRILAGAWALFKRSRQLPLRCSTMCIHAHANASMP